MLFRGIQKMFKIDIGHRAVGNTIGLDDYLVQYSSDSRMDCVI